MFETLHQALEHGAKHFPNKMAFKSDRFGFTYGAANDLANKLAALLLKEGLLKGQKVGVLTARNAYSPIAVYGCLKAGGVVVPIDPEAPISRIQYISNDCEINYLITEEQFRPIVSKLGLPALQVIGLDGLFSWEAIQEFPLVEVNEEVNRDDEAYIMYTSGTTGAPKGIVHTHYSGLSYARLSSDLYAITGEDVIMNHSPLHFDMSTFGYFTAPYSGASTYILPKMYSSFPASLAALLEKECFTILYCVPLILLQLLKSGTLATKDLSKVRWILFGGEPLPVDSFNQLVEVFDSATFSNVYGPAEVNQCTYYNTSEKVKELSIPLGKIWSETEALVVDESDNILPRGEIGELLIHSVTMMKAYNNNEQLTNKSVIEYNDKLFYKTGDLVVVQEDGNYYFVGRKDRQVKIKGSRVELTSVDQMILQYPNVEQAVSFIVEGNNENELQSVYTSKTPIEPTDLLMFLREHLPKYAVPRTIRQIEELPRTPAGKIDFKELTEIRIVQ